MFLLKCHLLSEVSVPPFNFSPGVLFVHCFTLIILGVSVLHISAFPARQTVLAGWALKKYLLND